MKKEYTEAEVYEAIKSGFSNLNFLVRKDLKKRWRGLEVSQKYNAGRSLVVMRDVAKNPENYFSRAKTQEAWVGRAEKYMFEHDWDSTEMAYYIVQSPQNIVMGNVSNAMRGNLYGEYARFCDDVQQWEYDRTSPKGAYRCLAEVSAEKIVGNAKEYKKQVDAELANPVKKYVRNLIKQYVR